MRQPGRLKSNSVLIGPTEVFGVDIDAETRCRHHHSEVDRIAIKFACCGKYYACSQCHEEIESHEATVWPKSDLSVKAVLCGQCRFEMTIGEYAACHSTCPNCGSSFNPGCKTHWHLYFEA